MDLNRDYSKEEQEGNKHTKDAQHHQPSEKY